MPTRQFLEDDPLWYKDAVIYELHVKAYADANNDGIGDFRGLIEKLDFLQDLGVTAIWLLPFYPSPQRDGGYDISNYNAIHPDYGDLRDFKQLLRHAHRRGLRVITEVVLNHTSDQHPWFQRARRAQKGSSWRDYYVWSDTPERYVDARIIFKDFESSNWSWDPVAHAYYWHRFYSHQPDLNYENPRVRKEMLAVIDHWLDMGVDGLRLDAIPYLYEAEGTNCENLPATHEFIKELRAHVDKKFRNRMLLAEANQWAEDTLAYFGKGDECHMAFNFPVMPRLYVALQTEDRFPIIDILDPPLSIPDNCQWALFLRNHDELTLEMVTDEERDYMYRFFAADSRARINLGIRRRLAPLLDNNRRRIELMKILLFSLPGTPVIYYGDEIGMGDNFHLGDRDGVRTPMQWSPDRNAGFSKANPQELYLPLIIDPEYHYEVVNVENQQRNPSSFLWWMKRLIAMRKRHKAFGRGDIHFLSPRNNRVLAFTRRYEGETILVVINLSRFSQAVELDLSDFAGSTPRDLFSWNEFPIVMQSPYIFTLGPHNHFWLQLSSEKEPIAAAAAEVATALQVRRPQELLTGPFREQLEQTVLPEYLYKSRWFGGKSLAISKLSIIEQASLPIADFAALILMRLNYRDGDSNLYLLPLFLDEGPEALRIRQESPKAVIAEVSCSGNQGILYDGLYSPQFHEWLLDLISRRRTLRAANGRFIGLPARRLRPILQSITKHLESRQVGVEQSNSSVAFNESLILKIFRKPEEGPHPDVEIVRALTEFDHFEHIPAYAGAIEYRPRNGRTITIGLMQQYVPNEGDAWKYAVGKVVDYLESATVQIAAPASATAPSAPANPEEKMLTLCGAFFCEMMTLLGRRTAELHIALSRAKSSAFAPEPFSTLYQRSVYQSMRGLTRGVFRTLERALPRLTADLRTESEKLLQSQSILMNRLSRITERKINALKIRIHGDFHLGQVLFTGKDFKIIDFEGEPRRPLGERLLKRCALRDVAGMMRSFDYAAHTGLFRHHEINQSSDSGLIEAADKWRSFISKLFLQGYFSTASSAAFIPPEQEEYMMLLEIFILEKAIYELGYELDNRPDWVRIPLKGIMNIIVAQSSVTPH